LIEEFTVKRKKCDVCGDWLNDARDLKGIYEPIPYYAYFKSKDDDIHLCPSCAIMTLEYYNRIVDKDTIETMKKKINYQRRDIIPV
jgi:hypothetical protein